MILILGRFQPLHNGHMKMIKHALEEDPELIIAIGSAGRSNERQNPLSGDERKQMIETILKTEGLDAKVVLVPNTDSDRYYVEHVEKQIGAKPKKLISENPWSIDLFTKAGYSIIVTDRHFELSSTDIRRRIAEGERWEHLVPSKVADYLRSIDAIERIKETEKMEPINFSYRSSQESP